MLGMPAKQLTEARVMIGMRIVLLGIVVVVLVSCGPYWHQDGKSQLETDKDYVNCQGFASVTTPTGTPDDRFRLAEVTDNCMRERGYRQKGIPFEFGTTQEQRKHCAPGDIVSCR
jgi:hypothetical protein